MLPFTPYPPQPPLLAFIATSVSLDDEALYPMFVRNAPSDVTLVDTIAAMLVSHSITAVGILAIGDSYGIRSSQLLVDKLVEQNVTVVIQRLFSSATRTFAVDDTDDILSTNINSMVCSSPTFCDHQALELNLFFHVC